MLALIMILAGFLLIGIGGSFYKSENNNSRQDGLRRLILGVLGISFGITALWYSQDFQRFQWYDIPLQWFVPLTLTLGITTIILGILSLTIWFKATRILYLSIFLILLGAVSLVFGIGAIIIPLKFEAIFRNILLISPRQILLVLVIGLLAYIFYLWSMGSKPPRGGQNPQSGEWRALLHEGWWFSVFLTLLAIIILDPYFPKFFKNMTNVKTPWFEASFNNFFKDSSDNLSSLEMNLYTDEKYLVPGSAIKNILNDAKNFISLKLEGLELELIFNPKNTSEILKRKEFLESKIEKYQLLLDEFIRSNIDDELDFYSYKIENENFSNRLFIDKVYELHLKFEEIHKNKFSIDSIPMTHIIRSNHLRFIGSSTKAIEVLNKVLRDNRDRDLESIEQRPIHCFLGNVLQSSGFRKTREGIKEIIFELEGCLSTALKVKEDYEALEEEIDSSMEKWAMDLKNISSHMIDCKSFSNPETKEFCITQSTIKDLKGKLVRLTTTENYENYYKNGLAYLYAKLHIKEILARDYAEYLRKVLKEKPENAHPDILDTIGLVYFRFGRDQEEIRKAVLYFQEAEDRYLQKIYNTENTSIKDKEYNLHSLEITREHKRGALNEL